MPEAHPVTTTAPGASCASAQRHTASDAGDGAREPETPTVQADARRDESAEMDTADTDGTGRGQKDRAGGLFAALREPEAARKGPRGATRT